MTQSMTAFASHRRQTEWGEISCELRSVNHRYLDASIRLPEGMRDLEPKIRDCLRTKLSRGKVDVSVRFQPSGLNESGSEVNQEIAGKIIGLAVGLNQLGQISPLTAADVLRWPGVLETPQIDYKSIGLQTIELINSALTDLVDMRAREGSRLVEVINERLAKMKSITVEAKTVLPDVVKNYKEKLQKRLAEIKAELDDGRLEQEITLFAQRIDIDEELDRLLSHFKEFENALAKKVPIGRRLDFLSQELNREANTLTSKSTDMRLTNSAIELKVLIEQVREQVQNIE